MRGRKSGRSGGHLDRQNENSLTGVFGAVQAYEDDVERAVAAALAMQRVFEAQLSELARQQPRWRDGLLDLDLRTAVDVGEAIVTQIDDAGGGGRISVAGDVTRSVARLLDRISPGAVGVSEDARRLAAPLFHWEQVSDGDGPGYFRPVRSKAQAGKGRGIAGMRSALVGRAAEVQAIRSRVEHLGSGPGGIVTLVGEAGIGKSRLVAETRAATSSVARWVEGRCLSYSSSTVYSLWASTLRALIGVPDNAAANVVERALWRTLRSLVPDDPDASRPYLAHLLGLPQEAAVETMLAGMDVQARQNAIAYAVRRLLQAAARVQPLVVVYEDLHWADDSSLALLRRLLSLTEEAPVLFVCVMRPLPGHGSWVIRDTALEDHAEHHTDITLEPLTSREGEVLLGNLLLSMPGPDGRESVDTLPAELKAAILSRGEGNPFFVEEVLRALIRGGTIRCSEDSCEWVADGGADIGIPETLYGVLQSRIDQLTPGARRVLQLASVVGHVFSLRLLSTVAGRGDLAQHIAILVEEQLIRERRGGDEAEYIFKHQLTLEATYGGLLKRVRRPLHRRVAEAIERLYPDQVEANLALLAHHWELAGDVARAISYLQRAGDRARAQYAMIEAEDYYDRALALVPSGDKRLRYELLLARYDALRRKGVRSPRATRDTPEILRLAEALGEHHRRAEMLLRKAEYELSLNNDQGVVTAQRAIELARADGDGLTEAMGAYLLGWVTSHTKDYDQAASDALMELAIQLCRENGLSELEGRILRRYAIILAFEDKFAEGSAAAERALEIWRRMGNRVEEGRALNVLAIAAAGKGEFGASRAFAEESLAVCRETGNRFDEGYALATLSLAHRGLGAYAAARDIGTEATIILKEVGETDTWARIALGRAYLHLGCWDQALDQFTSTTGEPVGSDPYDVAWSIAAMSQIALLRGDSEQAAVYGREAVASPPLRLSRRHFLPALGAALIELGRLDEACEVYEEAVTLWEEVGLPYMATEPMAGAAEVALLQGDLERALGLVERVLACIERPGSLGAAIEPLRVYLISVRVLAAAGDSRADRVLREGHRMLKEQAARIDDESSRSTFLDIPVHRELLEQLKHDAE